MRKNNHGKRRLVRLETHENGEVRTQETGELVYRRTSAGPAFWCKNCGKEHIFKWSLFDHLRAHHLEYGGMGISWNLICIDGEHFGVTSPDMRVRGEKYVTHLIGIITLQTP